MSTEIELEPAATVLLIRDSLTAHGVDVAPEASSGLEVLMLRRNSKLAFGGMWVFPGGRVDPEDRVSNVTDSNSRSVTEEKGAEDGVDRASGQDDQHHARRAAVREAHEETGLTLEADSLVPWSYWIPPPTPVMAGRGPARRFSTWFFVAPAPDGEVAIDHGEIHDDRWMAPSEALDRHQAGEIELVAPTWVTLWQLSQHDSVAATLNWASANPSPEFRTRPLRRKPLTLAWQGDAAYEQAGEVMERVAREGENLDPSTLPDLVAIPGPRNRLIINKGGWEYQHSL